MIVAEIYILYWSHRSIHSMVSHNVTWILDEALRAMRVQVLTSLSLGRRGAGEFCRAGEELRGRRGR